MPTTSMANRIQGLVSWRCRPLKMSDLLGKFLQTHYQLFIGGQEFPIYADNPSAASFDATGKQLPRQSASKLLKEGNIVDVGFFVKNRAHPYYMLSDIHLVQGEIR